jgi:Sec-independent protein secretion pathway component TatC
MDKPLTLVEHLSEVRKRILIALAVLVAVTLLALPMLLLYEISILVAKLA